jgi:hypothetical protein
MTAVHSLEDLKRYQAEATKFLSSELMLLKEAILAITDERLGKTAVLLVSANQTGSALLQLAAQTDYFTNESVMLARSFIEKVTNFCYASLCDAEEYRAFVLHPVYKRYHIIGMPTMQDSLASWPDHEKARKEQQEAFRKMPIVQEALTKFSETKPHLNWTKKTLSERIQVIAERGKLMDVFFTLCKLQYYSDASEALHGSLYGCTFHVGTFDPDFDSNQEDELDKKLRKEIACVLLHLGMLIHESFTLISYSNNITEIWDYSYRNRGQALNLLMHIIGRKTM